MDAKKIKVSIALASGTFDGENNEITLPAVPIKVSVSKTGGQDLPKCTIEAKNLALATMEKLTVLSFRKLQSYNNVVKVEAGSGDALDLVFMGEISTAVPVFAADGTATFKIEASAGYYPLQKSSPPVSVQGETTIEKLMAQFAADAGYTLENSGVTGSVKNCVFSGSPIVKARQLAKQTGIDFLITDGKFIIMPSYSDSRGDTVPFFSASSGLLGYPSFTNDGISCKVIFSPLVDIGGLVKIESIVPKASGVWRVDKITTNLQANDPAGGEWTESLEASWVNEE